MVSEEDFVSFSHYKSMGVNDPRGMASLDPRGLTGRIYVKTKYMSTGPHGFKEDFSHYKSTGANNPRGMASLGPRGLIRRIYVGDH